MYTQAVKEACYGFEKGLQNMIRKLSLKPARKIVKPNRKSRTAVSKVRRTTFEGSQQGQHQAYTSDSAELAKNC